MLALLVAAVGLLSSSCRHVQGLSRLFIARDIWSVFGGMIKFPGFGVTDVLSCRSRAPERIPSLISTLAKTTTTR